MLGIRSAGLDSSASADHEHIADRVAFLQHGGIGLALLAVTELLVAFGYKVQSIKCRRQ